MKVIIAGSRTVTDFEVIAEAMSDFETSQINDDVAEVISGGARGVDKLGEQWANEWSLPVTIFPANWHAHGKSAGPIRNRQMAEYADALVAIWDGKSPGTKNMIEQMEKLGKLVVIHRI